MTNVSICIIVICNVGGIEIVLKPGDYLRSAYFPIYWVKLAAEVKTNASYHASFTYNAAWNIGAISENIGKYYKKCPSFTPVSFIYTVSSEILEVILRR